LHHRRRTVPWIGLVAAAGLVMVAIHLFGGRAPPPPKITI
jgi:hypothetical protein